MFKQRTLICKAFQLAEAVANNSKNVGDNTESDLASEELGKYRF